MFESKSVVLFVAVSGFFAPAFLVMGLCPWTEHDGRLETSVMEQPLTLLNLH